MDVETKEKEERDRGGCGREIEIKVNDHEFVVVGRRQTGRSIKEAAIAQGVPIQLDFVLSLERGNRRTKIVGDDDVVTVNKNSCFLAVPNDDNSRTLLSDVEEALKCFRRNFPNASLDVTEDGSGGAFVVIDPVPLGVPYQQLATWVGFHVTAACQHADVYPHFVRADISRIDGNPLGEGMSPVSFQIPGQPRDAVQISRRTNKVVPPSVRNPLLKLLKVLQWLKSR